MPLNFQPDTPTATALLDWWRGLEDDKGGRAALRRCHEPIEALFVPAYHRLFQQMQRIESVNATKLPAVAILITYIKTPAADAVFAAQLARPKPGGTTPIVSELRFRRLLQCQALDDFFPALRRTIRLLDGKANLLDLANSVYHWGGGWRGARLRREWAYAYYEKLPNA